MTAATARADDAVVVVPDPLPRLKLDDLRLRLDSPLFARDLGLGGSAVDAPEVRELAWHHAVTPVDHPEAPIFHTGDSVVDPLVRAEESASVGSFELLRTPALEDDPSPDRTAQPTSVRTAAAPTAVSDPEMEVDPFDPLDSLTSGELALLRVQPSQPTPRDPDPVLNGLAEMIVRSTPANGLQAVARAGEAPAAPSAGPTVQTAPPAAADGDGHPSAVEVELSRLDFVPDVDPDEPSGPVDVPRIAVSEAAAQPAVAAPAAVVSRPALTLASGEAYAARSSAAPTPRRSYAEFTSSTFVQPRRRQRHIARRLITLVVLLSMVAGGLFAAKIYVLDARWPGELEPFADTVGTARNLSFDHAVDLRTLPVEEYAVELGSWALSVDDDAMAATAAEWRALGLLSGELDVSAVGLSAMPTAPAFYDHRSETVVVLNGVPSELRSFALHRALALALLDQEYGWGKRVREASPAVRIGTLALYDSDALATALGLLTDANRELVVSQIFGLYGTYSIPSSPAPFATVVGGRLGLAAWPFIESLDEASRTALLTLPAPTDARVLDVRRLAADSDVTAGANSRGMLFWYHVLAARVDDDLAWQAASSWQGDDVTLLGGGAATCVAAVFSSSAVGAAAAETAFGQWALAAPPTATTTVTSSPVVDGSRFTVNACDPGSAVATSEGTAVLALGAAPLWSELYRQARAADPTLTAGGAACMASQAGAVSIADERGVVDPVGGWSAPAAHPLSRGSC